jgi:hypothetical protein
MLLRSHFSPTVGGSQATYFLLNALSLYQMMTTLMNEEQVLLFTLKEVDPVVATIDTHHTTIPGLVDNHQHYPDNLPEHQQSSVVVDIVKQVDENNIESRGALFSLLQLAMYSNMGHVYYLFFVNKQVNTCCIALTQLLHNPLPGLSSPSSS